jgi:hypothetical protein
MSMGMPMAGSAMVGLLTLMRLRVLMVWLFFAFHYLK